MQRTRWHLASGDAAEARRHLDEAKGLVEACGYGRRTGEVAESEEEIASTPHPNPLPGPPPEPGGTVLAGERGPEERQEDERHGKERQGKKALRT